MEAWQGTETAEEPLEAMKISYGINRRIPGSKRRRDIEHRNGSLEARGDWGDDAFHRRIIKRIQQKHPGWLVTGFCRARDGQITDHIFLGDR